MNFKRFIVCTATLLIGVGLPAQERPRFSAAVTVGANGYASAAALDSSLPSYEMEAVSLNWTNKMPAFGAEASLLINDRWKTDLGGMFQFSYNPGYMEVPGTAENAYDYSPGDLPSYRAVPADQQVAYVVYLAGSYCFKIPAVPAMRPYLGLRFSFAYANDQKKYDELSSMGISSAENFSMGVSCVGGVDYFLASNFFIGASLDLVRYVYGVTKYRPQDGLAPLAGDTHNLGAIGAPRIKIGFQF